MAGVYTYSCSEVQVIVGGAPMSGMADGTFVNIERDEQAYTKVTGADGSTSRSKSANRSGTITITLKQTSPSNDVLTGFMVADEQGDAGVVPVLVKDNSGRTLHAASAAWVQKSPSQDFAKEISNREWVMDCARLDQFIGGNTQNTATSD